MALSKREQERQRQRIEARRQEAIERRREEERDRAREEARIAEARQERLAFEAEQEAARSRREALVSRIRDERRRERAAADMSAERQSAIVDRIREAQQERRRGAQVAAEHREQLRHGVLNARRLEARTIERDEERVTGAANARRAAAHRARAASDREAAGTAGQRAPSHAARAKGGRTRPAGASGDEAGSLATGRGRAGQRDRTRRDREAADRAAAARAARLDEARAVRHERARAVRRLEDRETASSARSAMGAAPASRAAESADRRREDRARMQAAAGRRDKRREPGGRARSSEAQATQRRERARTDRAPTGSAAAGLARSRETRQVAHPTAQTSPARDRLDDRIPSGVLSGSLPWLRVADNRLATAAGDPVTLRGANVLGLGPPGTGYEPVGAGLDEASLSTLLDLGVGAVRVPIDRDRILIGTEEQGPFDALAELDRVVEQVASGGAYTILSLRTLGDATFGTLPDDSGGRAPNPLAPHPDQACIGLWRALGERYADEPAVLFDLFAAPHAALPDDVSGSDTSWDRWALWVRLTVAELRRVHPRALCIVAGQDWGTDLEGFPLLGTANEPIPNLLYAAAVMAGRPEPSLKTLARRLPVIVTELEVSATGLTTRAQSLAAIGVGWLVAARSGQPLIAPSRAGRLEPTILGTSTRRVLSSIPERPLVEPQLRPPSAFALVR